MQDETTHTHQLINRKKIRWMASYPKSGNTWVRLLLRAYLSDPSQLELNVEPKLDPKWRCIFGPADSRIDSINSFMGTKVAPEPVEYSNAVRNAFLQRVTDLDVGGILMKTHLINGEIKGIHTIPDFVSGPSIYITRHPYDVAVSFASHMNLTIDQSIAMMSDSGATLGMNDANFLPQPLGTWSMHVESWLGAQKFKRLVVRYEDLKTNCHAAFEKILNHLNLEIDAERLSAAIDATSFDKLKTQEKSVGFLESSMANDSGFFRSGKTGEGASTLSRAQREKLWQAHGKTAAKLNYGPKGEF